MSGSAYLRREISMNKKVVKVLLVLLAIALLCSACGSVNTMYVGPAFPVPGEPVGTMICIAGKCKIW